MSKYTLLVASLAILSQAATAQVDAGSQIRQLPPPPEQPAAAPDIRIEPKAVEAEDAPTGQAVRVDALRITGNTLFSEADLTAASGFEPGGSLTLADLRSLAARISAFYNENGYFLTQAYLPPQDITAGTVTIAVVEARYGEVGIENTSNLRDGVARGLLGGLDSGDIVASAPLERRLLLLSDLPGIVVRSTLAPGSDVGTSDLKVAIEPGPRFSGSLEADNGGNRYTGTYRFGGTVNLNNAAGLGDQLSLRLLASDSGLAFGRVSYQVPVGALTLGAAYSHLKYDLGREFSNLDADGTANIGSLYASYPLIRSRDANLYALGNLEASWFSDRIGLLSTRSNKRSQTATLGLAGEVRDDFGGGGWTSGSIGWTTGNLDIRTPLDLAADAVTARSNGSFNLVQFALARQQTIAGPLSIFGSVRGQLAFDNLDSSEKMELGGAYGVRAYPEGEAFGDEGYIATAEVRLMLDSLTGSLPGRLQVFALIDYGQVDFAHDPWLVGPNSTHLSAYGAGLAWFGPDNLILRATYATRLGDQPVTSQPDRDGRAWLQIVKLF
jgi:hemolysin activation/secretion protein